MTAQPVLGKTTWMIADGYMSDTVKGEFVSHEAVCVLNLSGATAHIDLTLFFEDCEPLTGLHAVCEDRRTNHIRLDRMVNDEGKRTSPQQALCHSGSERPPHRGTVLPSGCLPA